MHACRTNRNAESFPLLRLPPEIRRNIYIEVLGDRLLHLKKFDDAKFDASDDTRRGDRWHLLVADPAAAEPIGKPNGGSKESGVGTNSSDEESSVEEEGVDQVTSDEESIVEEEGFDQATGDEESSVEEGTDQVNGDEESSVKGEDSDQLTDDERLFRATASYRRHLKKMTRLDQEMTRTIERLKWLSQEQVQRLIGHTTDGTSWRELYHSLCDEPVDQHSRSLGLDAHLRVPHLTLLRTCRQVYTEANQVLWETNIFSFNDVHSFTCFIKDRTTHQKGLLKKLRLAINFRRFGVSSWSELLTIPLVIYLQGLRFLWLPIHYCPEFRFDRLEKIDVFLWTGFHSTDLDRIIRKLATLPLTWVKVTLTNKKLEDRDGPDLSNLWTQQQREKYADMVRTRLLAVDGAELLQQDESVV